MSLTKATYSMIQGAPLNVLDFGADPTGVADSTNAFNNAINVLRAATNGGALYVPVGTYLVTSINATNLGFVTNKYVTIFGDGNQTTYINGSQDDVAVLDCTGSSNLELRDFRLGTESNTYAQTGLLLCRSTTSNQCNGNNFYNLWVQGNFKKAACISIGAETSRWFAPAFRNPYPNGSYKHCTFYTADQNGIGASSLYQTILADPIDSPNTDNAMFKPNFFAEYEDNVSNVVIQGSGQWSFYSALLLCKGNTNNYMVTYVADPNTNIFNGGIQWYEPLIEGPSYTAHRLIGYAGIGVEARFQGIKQTGGYNNNWFFTSYTLISGVTGIGLPYNLVDCGFTNLRHNVNSSGIVYADVITQGEYDCITVRILVSTSLQGYTQNVKFGRFEADSQFGNQQIGVPIQTSGTTAPTTGYYPKNSIAWNANPASAGYVGWVCTAAGTPGTWKTFGLIS